MLIELKVVKFLIPLMLLVLIAGCSGPKVQYAPLNNPMTSTGEAVTETVESRGNINPDEVRIFITQKPEKPYVELGVLSYSTGAYIPNEERAFQGFKVKAAEIGADGVIILASREQGVNPATLYGYRWMANSNNTLTTFRGMAIQFIEE